MKNILTTGGSAFMQMLAEFYRQNRYAEKGQEMRTKHAVTSDKASKTEENVQEMLSLVKK